MPLPTPRKNEKQSDFVNRCVSTLTNKGEGESAEQRVAICYSQFKKAKAAEAEELEKAWEKVIITPKKNSNS